MDEQTRRDIERAREPYGPEMSDTAVHIALLETERDGLRLMVADLQREVDQWVKNSAVSQRRVETLERQLAEAQKALHGDSELIAEWSRQNLAIIAQEVQQRKRADKAERELAEMRTALERLRSYAAGVWFDEADAVDEEREEMQRALDAIRGHRYDPA